MARPTYTGGRTVYDGQHATTGERQTYTGQPAPAVAPAAKKKGDGGVLGTLSRLPGAFASDVVKTGASLGPGIYHVGKLLEQGTAAALTGDQKKLDQNAKDIKALGKGSVTSIKTDLSHPLRHPGFTALDLLTLGSAGAGAGARVAGASRVAREGGAIADVGKALVSKPVTRSVLPIRSPRLAATGEGPAVTKLSETAPLVRGRQVISNKALAKIKYTQPVVGEGVRFGKEIRRTSVREGLKDMPAYRTYVHATKKLSDHEWAALNLIPRDVHPTDLASYWKGTANESIAANPNVAKLVTHPTERLQAAVVAARQLSDQGAGIFKDLGIPADKSPTLFRERVAKKLGTDVKPLHGNPFYLPDVPRPTRHSDPFAAFGGGKGQPRIPGSGKQNKGILQAAGKLNLQSDVLGPNFLSRVKLKTHSAIHQGLLDSSMKLTPSELDTVIAEHGGVPKGWDYVTAPSVTKTIEKTVSSEPNTDQLLIPGTQGATKTVKARVKFQTPTRPVGGTPQRIGSLKRLEGNKPAEPTDIAGLLKNPSALDQRLGQPLGTQDKKAAYFDGTHYYLAPKNTIRAAAGEFHQSSGVVRYMIEKPLSAWRAIILGARVGFLTNNVVGNDLLYAIRSAGLGGTRAYLHAVQEAKGPNVVRQLLTDGPTTAKLGPRVTQQLMDEFFPEQVQGTFGRTQSPILESAVPSRARKLGQKAKLGIIPATQSIAETLPRRALVEVMLKQSPEFKSVYSALPKQTRTFEEAARKTLTEQGAPYQRLISDQVNRALGDYLNMSTFERETVRNILPFYSWYKAIATITYHMAADTPGRALAVEQLSQIGQEDTQRLLGKLPSYLQGFIPFGKPAADGTVTGVSTQGLNPFSTLPQLSQGVMSDVGNLGLTPMIQFPLDAYAQKQRYGGKAPGLVQLLAASGKTFAQGLPFARIASPASPSRLYPKRNRNTEILSFLGVPIKKPNLNEAHQRAKAGG